jgi:hypothetical protein
LENHIVPVITAAPLELKQVAMPSFDFNRQVCYKNHFQSLKNSIIDRNKINFKDRNEL